MRQLSFRLMDTVRTCSMYLRILSVPMAAHGVFVSRGAWSAGRDTLAAAAACLAGQGNSLFFTADEFFKIYQLFFYPFLFGFHLFWRGSVLRDGQVTGVHGLVNLTIVASFSEKIVNGAAYTIIEG